MYATIPGIGIGVLWLVVCVIHESELTSCHAMQLWHQSKVNLLCNGIESLFSRRVYHLGLDDVMLWNSASLADYLSCCVS